MFEGYAGTSLSGFRPEVESELAMARGEYLLEHANLHPQMFTGLAAEEATRRIDHFASRARYEGVVADSPRQLKNLLAQHEPNIYPGERVTCIFDPAKALCLKGSTATSPNTAGCQPTLCRNVALDDSNRQYWQIQAEQLESVLASASSLNPYTLSALTKRRQTIRQMTNK